MSHHATHLCYGNRDWRYRQTFSRHRDLKPGLWDDSIDSSVDASARLSRPALNRPMVNDNIVFNNSSSDNNSVDATEGRVFKPRIDKEDRFDALFADVKFKPIVRKPKLVLNPSDDDPFSRLVNDV